MKNLKKLFASVASVAILASMFPAVTLGAASYSDELQGAYDYAYGVGITTQSSIDSANMYGTLTRAPMAKMMVNFAKEVFNQKPDTSKACSFTDLAGQTEEMKGYIKEACQLGLMGQGITAFNPNGAVTRAQFGTVLSRVLRGEENEGGTPYYAKHLSALKDAGIMTNISNPMANEIRGYVMLMMQRADDTNNTTPAVCETPENQTACSLGLDTCPAECVDTTNTTDTLPKGDWALDVSATSDFVAGQSFPVAAGIKAGSFTFAAQSDDVVINGLNLTSKGLWARTDIAGVALMMNGVKISKTKTISSEDKVDLNLLTPVTIKKWSKATIDVIVTTTAAVWEHYFQLTEEGLNSNANDVSGLPSSTKMFKTTQTPAGTMTFSADGSLSTIKLGDKWAIVSKFKVDMWSVEDITLKTLTLKKNSSLANIHQDEDLVNFKLYINGTKVASTASMSSKYVSFNLGDGYKLEKNKTAVKFEVTADIEAGAGKTVAFIIDSDTDVMANGSNYGYGANIAWRTSVSQTTTINAGAITIEKVNAPSERIVKNKTNVELGTLVVKANGGKDVELSSLKLTIDTTTDSGAVASAFNQIAVSYTHLTLPTIYSV